MAGYSKTPLAQKLGIKPGFRACFLNAPPNYEKLLGALPALEILPKPKPPMDFIQVFFKDRASFEKQLPLLKKTLAPAGMIWVCWLKVASKIPTDLTESHVRGFGLKCGLVDVKVCAVDEVWSGLKFVIPVKNRERT
jgi:hypothetical protein